MPSNLLECCHHFWLRQTLSDNKRCCSFLWCAGLLALTATYAFVQKRLLCSLNTTAGGWWWQLPNISLHETQGVNDREAARCIPQTGHRLWKCLNQITIQGQTRKCFKCAILTTVVNDLMHGLPVIFVNECGNTAPPHWSLTNWLLMSFSSLTVGGRIHTLMFLPLCASQALWCLLTQR